MKKIAIPSQGDNFSSHFGHCPEFTIIEADGQKVVSKKVIPNPGHQPGFLPQYLKDLEVDCVLAGGMGRRAQELFNSNGIEVVTGVTGSISAAVQLYLKGNLKTGENICDH